MSILEQLTVETLEYSTTEILLAVRKKSIEGSFEDLAGR